MLCTKCGKHEASVHVYEEINGNRKEYYLCQDCAQESLMENNREILRPESFLEDMFQMSLAGSRLMEQFFGAPAALGGGYAASARREDDIPVLHLKNGKIVQEKETETNTSSKSEIEQLKDELNNAVSNEDYEKAAQLRDKISEMENKK